MFPVWNCMRIMEILRHPFVPLSHYEREGERHETSPVKKEVLGGPGRFRR